MREWIKQASVFPGIALIAAGCASITTGTTQTIDLSSSPDAAACTLTRAGTTLGTVTTPGRLSIKRGRDPITVDCTKEGYEDARTIMNAQAEKATYGNALVGGFIGMAIDNSTGANSRYDPSVAIELTPLSAADQAAKAAARKEAAVKVATAPAANGPTGPYDGNYTGQVDVLQTNIEPNVPHLRAFAVRVVNGVGTGTVKHALCDEPGEVFFLVEPSGVVRGKANTRNTTGCTDRIAMLEGRVDGDVMRLTLRLINNPQLVLARAADAAPVPRAASGSFDGEYKAGLEVAQGDLRQLWIRVRGTKATGTSRVALCPTPGAVSLNVDPSGAISGEADLQTSASCMPRKASLSGHAEGPRLLMTASFADGSKPQDFTFSRERRGVGVDD
jgi:hypothetical protein